MQHATQVVFGEGALDAKVVMVGEQPGDEEDTKGHPFIGPAGRLLNKAMVEAGLDREQIYVTNAVKHFKLIERGKRRIHAKPTGIEISSCRPWLEAELASIQPELMCALGRHGRTVANGPRDSRITMARGKFFPHRWAKELVATIHPLGYSPRAGCAGEESCALCRRVCVLSPRGCAWTRLCAGLPRSLAEDWSSPILGSAPAPPRDVFG